MEAAGFHPKPQARIPMEEISAGVLKGQGCESVVHIRDDHQSIFVGIYIPGMFGFPCNG